MSESKVKYPHVEVVLIGEDGNAFMIIARVTTAMKRAGIPKEEVDAWRTEATSSGSYDELLGLVMNTVEVV